MRAGHRDGGVGGQQQPDMLRFVIERIRCCAVEIQGTEVVAADVELQGKHAAYAVFNSPPGKFRPPLLGTHVWQPDSLLLIHRVQARALAGLILRAVAEQNYLVAPCLSGDFSAGLHHADSGELRAGNVVHHSPHDAHQRVLKGVLPVQIPSEVTELLS